MITDFKCKNTEALFKGRRVKQFANIERIAMRKLQQINTAYVSTINGAFALFGRTAMFRRLKSSIIIEEIMMNKREVPLIHPGEILLKEWLKPLGISQYALAKAIDVPPRRINEIVQGKRGITADTALRLATYFGTDSQSWLNLQSHYDAEQTRAVIAESLAHIQPFATA